MKKITEYVVAGVKADNEKVFMQRVGEMLERKGLLDMLTDGVPTDVRIVDEEALIASIKKRNKEHNNIKPTKAYIDDDFRVKVEYKYTRTYWYSTEEKAARQDWNNRHSSQDEEHQFSAEEANSSFQYDVDGVEILYV